MYNVLLIMANRRFALATINAVAMLMKLQFIVHQHSQIFLITNSRQWLIIHKVRVFIKMALTNLHIALHLDIMIILKLSNQFEDHS